ncbi:hypothetical protein TcWFU_002031 [Taenia crassiceps]|uniref:Uncharacterized protein n=1 Tax=Taenia crassiceps TaxID=6207 RepID=A0ABR4Q2L9_9CEST
MTSAVAAVLLCVVVSCRSPQVDVCQCLGTSATLFSPAYCWSALPCQCRFHVFRGEIPLTPVCYSQQPLPFSPVEQKTVQDPSETERTEEVERETPIKLIETLLNKAKVIDCQIQLFRDYPCLYRSSNGSNEYLTLKWRAHKVEGELNSMALRKEWGWLEVLPVPNHITLNELTRILGENLLEMRFLRPHHVIACFTSSDSAKSSVTSINSRFKFLKMLAKSLDEREVIGLLSDDGRKESRSDCTMSDVNV